MAGLTVFTLAECCISMCRCKPT